MNAKLLPGLLLAVGLVLILVTSVVPLYDYPPNFQHGEPVRLVEFFGGGLNLLLTVGGLAAVVLAVLALLGKTNRIWAIFALLSGLAVALSLLLVGEMGILCWDGIDAQGRTVGGCEEARPVLGWWLALAGAALILISGAVQLAVAQAGRPQP